MAHPEQSVADRIIQAVADATDTDPLELPLLYETLDPDALESLVQSLSDGEVSFQYAGRTVIVGSAGTVQLADRRTDGNSSGASATRD